MSSDLLGVCQQRQSLTERMTSTKTLLFLTWREAPREDPQGGHRPQIYPWCPSPKECGLGLLCNQGIVSSSEKERREKENNLDVQNISV